MTRLTRTLLVALCYAAGLCAANAADSSLAATRAAGTWFEARSQLRRTGVSPAFRAGVAAAFDETEEAERQIGIAARRSDPDLIDSYEALAELCIREGRYHSAGAYLYKAVAARHGDAARAEILSHCPDQSVTRQRPSSARCRRLSDGLFLAVTANGSAAEYLLDTGSSMSLLRKSEAVRLGLRIRSESLSVTGVSGDRYQLPLTTMDTLIVGGVTLHDVTFYVVDDSHFAEPGVLGLNAIVPLGSIRWHANGTFESGLEAPTEGRPNLCFDPFTNYMLIRAVVDGRSHTLILDTGSDDSALFPRLASRTDSQVQTRRIYPMSSSFGASTSVPATCAEAVTLVVAGAELGPRRFPLLLVDPPLWGGTYDGIVGRDPMAQFDDVTLNFRSMSAHLTGFHPQPQAAGCGLLELPTRTILQRPECPPVYDPGPTYECSWVATTGCQVQCIPKKR